MQYRLIRMQDGFDRAGIQHSEGYQRIKNGLFPPPIRLGKRASRLIESEIDAVIAAYVQQKSDREIRELVASLVRQRGEQAGAA